MLITKLDKLSIFAFFVETKIFAKVALLPKLVGDAKHFVWFFSFQAFERVKSMLVTEIRFSLRLLLLLL